MLQPLQFGKYLLLERIAVGGMAEVFVAKAFGVEGFERLIAIKKILPTMGEDSEFNTMFVDEARIAVQLAHANIVQVLELGKVDDNLFIAMEYISGRDVRQLLERFRKRGRPMPVPQACTIVAKVCEALDYAHRKRDARGSPLGIVHRDVSPQNVLVSFEGDVKLIDFGIAKAESRLQRTQAGILKGKFSYMSPEQVRGQAIDHRSDVFAVGVLLWELLCGEKLFTGDSDFAVLEKVRTGQIPLPRKVNPEISEALEKVMMKALATEVRDRYQWASELHDSLVRFTLIGDMVYGSRQLSEWMREEFGNEFDKEQKRLRTWLGITDAEVEVTPSDPMRRKPLPPRMQQELHQVSQPSHPAMRPPAPPDESEPEPLVQPPTPTGVRHRVPASKTATPPPGELRAVPKAQPKSQPPPPPLLEDLSHELPTMKMDGNALAAAEKALAESRAAKLRTLSDDDDDESTVREDGPLAAEAKAMATAQANRISENPAARLGPLPQFGARPADTGEHTPADPDMQGPALQHSAPQSSPPSRPITIKDRPIAQKLPSSLDPALLAGERLQPLPIQRQQSQPPPPPAQPAPLPAPPIASKPVPDAFDVSDDPTVAPRAMRTGGLSKPVRDSKAAPEPTLRSNSRRNTLIGILIVLTTAAGAWALWPTDIAAPGRLVLALTPSVAADLIIDGKPVGSIPPFVWSVERGPHKVEIRAAGFKPFQATVKIASAIRPTELQVALVSDAPMQIDGVILNQPGAPVVIPREPTHARWLTGKGGEPGSEPDGKTNKPEPVEASHFASPEEHRSAEPPASNRERSESAAHERERAFEPPPAPALAPAPVRASKSSDGTRVASARSEDGSRLRITTVPPGAEIVVDGTSVGKSPVAVPDLDSANVHIVAIALPGFKPERRVAKADDSRFAPLSLTLQPTDPAPAAPSGMPAPGTSVPNFAAPNPAGNGGTSTSEVPPPAVADIDANQGPIGYLVTVTKPVAKVIIDGKDTGRWTPVMPKYPISLPPGPHTVTFETAEGHRHDQPIKIETGKTSRVINMDL